MLRNIDKEGKKVKNNSDTQISQRPGSRSHQSNSITKITGIYWQLHNYQLTFMDKGTDNDNYMLSKLSPGPRKYRVTWYHSQMSPYRELSLNQ